MSHFGWVACVGCHRVLDSTSNVGISTNFGRVRVLQKYPQNHSCPLQLNIHAELQFNAPLESPIQELHFDVVNFSTRVKIKRKIIEQKYQQEIDNLYQE